MSPLFPWGDIVTGQLGSDISIDQQRPRGRRLTALLPLPDNPPAAELVPAGAPKLRGPFPRLRSAARPRRPAARDRPTPLCCLCETCQLSLYRPRHPKEESHADEPDQRIRRRTDPAPGTSRRTCRVEEVGAVSE